jgi:hypothetical protein
MDKSREVPERKLITGKAFVGVGVGWGYAMKQKGLKQ